MKFIFIHKIAVIREKFPELFNVLRGPYDPPNTLKSSGTRTVHNTFGGRIRRAALLYISAVTMIVTSISVLCSGDAVCHPAFLNKRRCDVYNSLLRAVRRLLVT